MRFTLANVKKGDILQARVSEVLSADEFIVDFSGDLMRIKNKTQRSLRAGQFVSLIVFQVSPLGFRLAKARKSSGLDITI